MSKLYNVIVSDNYAFIEPAPEGDHGATSWRDAKKQLRQWYLDKAKSLRPITELEYFQQQHSADF